MIDRQLIHALTAGPERGPRTRPVRDGDGAGHCAAHPRDVSGVHHDEGHNGTLIASQELTETHFELMRGNMAHSGEGVCFAINTARLFSLDL